MKTISNAAAGAYSTPSGSRGLSDDDGLSLVELLVALMVLGVTLSALASTLITSLTALSRDEKRVRATQLANQVIEDLRGTEWDHVGFYSDDPGYQSTYEGRDTVTLGTARPDGSPAPLPGPQTRERDGVIFTVTTNVYWTSPGDDPESDADLKGFHVLVEWSDRGRAYSFESAATRAPTPEEVPIDADEETPPPTTFAISDYSVSPTTVTVSPSGYTEQAITVTVTTSQPANSVVLTPGTSPSVSMLEVEGSDRQVWTHTVASGSGNYDPPGNREFTVDATGVDGLTDTQTQIVSFIQPSETPVTILTPAAPAPPGPLCVDLEGSLHADVTVWFEVEGVGMDDPARIIWTSPSGTVDAQGDSATDDGALFWATIPAGTNFADASTTLTIQATRTVDNASAAESFVYETHQTSDAGTCP